MFGLFQFRRVVTEPLAFVLPDIRNLYGADEDAVSVPESFRNSTHDPFSRVRSVPGAYVCHSWLRSVLYSRFAPLAVRTASIATTLLSSREVSLRYAGSRYSIVQSAGTPLVVLGIVDTSKSGFV